MDYRLLLVLLYIATHSYVLLLAYIYCRMCALAMDNKPFPHALHEEHCVHIPCFWSCE